MEHHRAAREFRPLQVGVELRQELRQHHAFVADAVRREADDMQPRHIAQALFGATARQIQGMRERLAALNPTASAKVANRLLEAHERNYWTPEPGVLEALRNAGADLEDRLEGVGVEVAA